MNNFILHSFNFFCYSKEQLALSIQTKFCRETIALCLCAYILSNIEYCKLYTPGSLSAHNLNIITDITNNATPDLHLLIQTLRSNQPFFNLWYDGSFTLSTHCSVSVWLWPFSDKWHLNFRDSPLSAKTNSHKSLSSSMFSIFYHKITVTFVYFINFTYYILQFHDLF